jgi:hypothetical protein
MEIEVRLSQALNPQRLSLGNPFSRKKVSTLLSVALLVSIFNVIAVETAKAETATIAGRNATLVSPSATTNLTGISVGGLAAGTTYLVAVGLSNAPAGASLKIQTYAGITASYGYTAPGIYASFATVSFYGSLTDVNNALGSLQYISGAATGSPTLKVSASSYTANYALNGYNGHFYTSSTTLGLANATYTSARTAAKGRTYQGQTGYLTTITTSGENDFITNNIINAVSIWIGATDDLIEGQWRWDASGGSPEANLRFFDQTGVLTGAAPCNRTGGANNTSDGISYSRWASGEPNDYCSGGEDYAVTNWGGTGASGGTWNDCPNDGCGANRAYVIEFGTNAADGGFVNANSDLASNTFSLLYSSNSTTTYSASSTTPTYGSAVTLTANVTAGATGTVAFKDASSNVLCTTGNLSSGTASCSWTPATRATYAVTAFYSGDGSYTASNSSSANVSVTTRPITIKSVAKSAIYTGSSVSVSNSFSITSGTLVGSDSISGVTFTYTSTPLSYDSVTAPTNAGRYTITPSAATFAVGSASNYNITYDTSRLSITLADEVDNVLSLSSGSHFAESTIAGANALEPSSTESFTVAAWVRPTNSSCSTRCTIFSREGQMRLTLYLGKISFILYNTNNWNSWTNLTVQDIPNNQWSHIALTRNGTAIKVFLNGTQIASYTQTYVPLASNNTYKTYIGTVVGPLETFVGAIDEVKIWKSDRSNSIAADMNSSDELATGLVAYWNFNEGSQITAYNSVPTATSQTDLTLSSSSLWNSVLVSDIASLGPYSVRTFYRSYLTSNDGWRVPSTVTKASALVVGGGGGAGFNSGGGGSGGGVSFQGNLSVSGINPVIVGSGGLAATVNGTANSGISSTFGATTVSGGNGGVGPSGAGGMSISGSGAGGAGSARISDTGVNGGNGPSYSITGSSVNYAGGGGGGGWITNTVGGTAGAGGGGAGGGGGASSRTGSSNGASGTENTGGGGGGGSVSSATSGNGGSGVVILRWITASVPTYTKPTIAYLNVGMTETFTTNVAADSATAMLTRTFKWESTTAGASGAYTLLKTGTGASNAAFSWVPSDTSTSGSNFLYRLTVTDSDTAGLFITDSSTAYAIINPTLLVAGTQSIKKTINVTRNESYTISQGTPTYRYSLSPVISGITLDTSTAGIAVLKIAETATVGTYLETLTVTDSVTGTVLYPISITISAPPNLINTGEIASNGLILNLEAGNSRSIQLEDTTTATSIIWNDLSGAGNNAQTSGTYDARPCVAPTYYRDHGGYLQFNGSNTCYRTPDVGMSINKSFTAEAWFKMSSASLAGSTTLITQNWPSANNVNLALGGADGSSNIRIGFYNGTWYKSANGYTPIQNRWTHAVGTYDGASLKLYIDGILLDSTIVTAGLTGGINNNGYSIGKSWAGGAFFNGQIASIRVYNQPLTAVQVAQNYDVTKNRFTSDNQLLLKPVQKYGTLNLESFTVSAGGDTKTVSFAVGNSPGISWDTTSTPGVVKLSVQESLTVGTYYDTITVTDNFSASTFIPIKFTVTKADTITVTVNSPSALNYTGSTASFTPTLSISGLKGSDSATASSLTLTQTRSGASCAMGGTCVNGDRGPGGGIVFITPSTASSNGKYFEAAPDAWYGANDLSTVGKFCTSASSRDNTNEGATQFGIGWGETNTAIFRVNCTGGAVKLATDYRGGGFSNWFVPNKNELAEMAKIPGIVDLINVTNYWGYWSSTEDGSGPASTMSSLTSSSWTMGAVSKSESARNMVRPVRMFTPCHSVDSCTAFASTSMPTNAGTYRLTPSALTLSSGSLSNYEGVTYASGLLTINKVSQTPIKIGQYDAFPGVSTYPLNVYGGSGTGVMRRTLTSAGTASCTLTNLMFINATTPGKCEVRVTKAADFNYFMETATATIYWIQFVDRYTNSGPTSPTDLAISGGTAVEKRTYETFTVLSFADETGTAVTSIKANTKLRVIGTGFVENDGTTQVFFGIESVSHSGLTFNTLNPLANYVLLTVPTDAETDRVVMRSAKGWATSPGTLTILP